MLLCLSSDFHVFSFFSLFDSHTCQWTVSGRQWIGQWTPVDLRRVVSQVGMSNRRGHGNIERGIQDVELGVFNDEKAQGRRADQ